MSFIRRINRGAAAVASNDFQSEITDLSIDNQILGFSKEDDVTLKSITLSWSYDLDVRKYGIKSLLPIVPDQSISIVGTWMNPDTEDEEDFTKEVAIKSILVKLEKSEDSSLALFPVEFEFYKGKWIVVFQA
jgi:hypothetical protein